MQITIRRPDDFHVHLRDGQELRAVASWTEAQFARALVMPNTKKPILTGQDAVEYASRIKSAAPRLEPLMTIKLVASTTAQIVQEAKAAGVVAGKFYPEGVTTNSEDGVREVQSLFPVFKAMEDAGMVLCLHGEAPGAFCMDREFAFLADLVLIANSFPGLRIVLEHVTTDVAVRAVRALSNVAATITAHHLLLTLDDVVGDKLNPHHFCKPIPKRWVDREELQIAATSGDPKFFLGTDSAPHQIKAKECSSGCAGVFSAPVALQTVTEVFEQRGALDKLEAFTSINGATFYGLPLNEGTITLKRVPMKVPSSCGVPVVFSPYRAGETLPWSVERT